MSDPILDPLDEQQREAVVATSPLAIRAPAGSGKTRVLAHRIAYQIATQQARATQSVAISFTRAAAWELHRRIRGLGEGVLPRTGTFHSLALGLLKETYPLLGRRLPTLVSDQSALMHRALPEMSPRLRPRVAAEIDRLRALGLGPESIAEDPSQVRLLDPEWVIDAYRRLDAYKRAHGLADFADLLTLATSLLATEHPAVYRARLAARHLFIDEFQDTNPAQLAFVRAWTGGDLSGLTVVGDPDQSIYAWNGADPSIMRTLTGLVPGLAVIDLERNYRARSALVEAANAVRPSRTPMRAHRPGGQAPTLIGATSERQEGVIAARRIRELATLGVPYSSMAVLARTVRRLGPVTDVLEAHHIPHGVPGRTVLASNPQVDLVLRDALQRRLGISEVCDLIEERRAEDGDPRALRVLSEIASELRRQDPGADAGALRDLVRELQVPGLEAVTVTTFHRAKGLQWHHVHLIGLGERSFPDRRQPLVDEDEERRLLYVAITRATDSLTITWSLPSRGPSAWLADLASAPPVTAPRAPTRPSAPLGARLVAWRLAAARARHVPADQILSDRELAWLARHPVTTEAELVRALTRSLAGRSQELTQSLLAVLTDPGRR
jgi:DNA helicase-2/ATP-dependent DNA helicase PcrA